MTEKKRNPLERKAPSAQRPDPRAAQWLDRRSFLMSAGKFSAAAAGLIAGAPTLISGCFGDDDSDGEGETKPLGKYKDIAKPADMDEDTSASLGEGEEAVYEIDIEEPGDYMLTISSESSLPEEGSVRASLLDPEGEEIWSEDIGSGSAYTEGWENLEPGTYYLVVESDADSVEFVFTVAASDGTGEGGTGGTGEGGTGEGGTGEGGAGEGGTGEGGAGEGGTGGEWEDFSEWVDGGWTDNAWTDNSWSDSSGWKDAGSGTWVAYSDTWYNGEWDDGWLNYGYY
jgi:hypothetical protein